MSRQFFINLARRSIGKTAAQVRPSLQPVFMPPAPTLPVAESSAPHIPFQKPARDMGTRERHVPDSLRPSGRMSVAHAATNDLDHPTPKMGLQDHITPEASSRPPRDGPPVAASFVAKNDPQDSFIRPDLQHDDPRQRPLEPIKRSPRGNLQTAAEPGKLSQPLQTGDKVYPHGKRDIARKKPEVQKSLGEKGEKHSVKRQPLPEPLFVSPQNIVIEKTVIERGESFKPVRTEPPAIQMVRGPAETKEKRAVPEKVEAYGTPVVKPAKIIEKPLYAATTSGPEPTKISRSKESFDKRAPVQVQEAPRTIVIDRTTVTEKKENRVSSELPAAVDVARITPASGDRRPLQPKFQHGDNSPPVQVNIGMIDLQVRSTEQPGVKPQYRRKRPQGFAGFQRRRTYLGWEE